jgi:hypothetical protein
MLPELIIPTNLNPSCQFLLTGWIFQARCSEFIVVDGVLCKQLYLLYAYIINFPVLIYSIAKLRYSFGILG